MSEQVMEVDDFLAHYGVKGMRWGHRKAKVSSEDIKGARTRLAGQHVKMAQKKQEIKAAKKAGKSTTRAQNQLRDMEVKFLNDPDRQTSLRLTTGEKWLHAAVFALSGPPGMVAVGANAAGRKAIAKTIDKRQASGYYNNRKAKK